MALFSGKIVSAQFIDPPNNMLIEILYQEGDTITPYTLGVDFTQQDFNDLLEEISLEQIEQNTKNILKSESQVFEKMINKEIDRRWGFEQENIKELRKKLQILQEKFVGDELKSSEVNGKDLLDIINLKDKDDDFIFNLKVAILEDPEIGKSKDKSLKLSIRKSKSVWELLRFYTNARF